MVVGKCDFFTPGSNPEATTNVWFFPQHSLGLKIILLSNQMKEPIWGIYRDCVIFLGAAKKHIKPIHSR
jgi:hypothetical protein